MPKCSLCSHPDRIQIELLSVAGASLDSLVNRFELDKGGKPGSKGGRDRLWRHMRSHVTAATRAALVSQVPLADMAERAAAENVSLLDHMRIVRSGLMQLFVAAVAAGDAGRAPAVAGRLLEVFRDLGALSGEMMRGAPQTTINNTVIINSTVFLDLQSMLIERLRGYPEALSAVVAGLNELEARALPPMIEPSGVADARAA